jgi:transcriptional regulator with XRE-family HTH domain
MKPNKFGERLAAVLKALDMSQSELADKSGLTPAAISQILAGKREPSLSSICAILEVVPVKFESLVKP